MPEPMSFSADLYLEIQRILDAALGTEEADGAGEGIVADVALLASQRDAARAELADLRGQNAMTEANFDNFAEVTVAEKNALREQIEDANASLRKLAEDKLTLQAGLLALIERTAHLADLLAGDVNCTPCRVYLDGGGGEPCDEYSAPSGPIKAALGVS